MKFSRVVIPAFVVALLAALLFGGTEERSYRKDPKYMAQITEAKTTIRVIHEDAIDFRHRTGACPSVHQLVPEAKTNLQERDPWQEPYLIDCDSERIEVTSKGKDRTLGTGDDIIYSELR